MYHDLHFYALTDQVSSRLSRWLRGNDLMNITSLDVAALAVRRNIKGLMEYSQTVETRDIKTAFRILDSQDPESSHWLASVLYRQQIAV